MPNPFETMPSTSEHLQFPGGDVEGKGVYKGCMLLQELSEGDSREQFRKLKTLRTREMPQWRSFPGQEVVWRDIKSLAEWWGATRLPEKGDRGPLTVSLAFQYSVSFLQSSHLLPTTFNNFSREIVRMTSYDDKSQEFFADEAWAGMRLSHPRLYSVMAPLCQLTAEAMEVEDQDSLVLLEAGMALPYIMASTTRMNGYMRSQLDREIIPGL